MPLISLADNSKTAAIQVAVSFSPNLAEVTLSSRTQG